MPFDAGSSGSAPATFYPKTCVVEQAHPRRVAAPLLWVPRHLRAHEYALWMRHGQQHAAVIASDTRDARGGPVRVLRVALRGCTVLIDEAQCHTAFALERAQIASR